MSPCPDDQISHRPPELEDWLNGALYHPLAMRLAVLVRHSWITPNMLSLAGLICIVLAAAAYGAQGGAGMVLAALGVHMAWHVFDGADGDLARLTGRESAFGEIVDGLSDYGGHIALYIVLGHILSAQWGGYAWALMLAAGAARIVQANFYESVRRHYQWRVYGKQWIGLTNAATHSRAGPIGALASLYLRLSRGMLERFASFDDALTHSQGDERYTIIAAVKREYAAVLGPLSILSANYRTLALGVSMLAGSPLWFFLFEFVGLSIAYALLRLRVSEAEGKLAAAI